MFSTNLRKGIVSRITLVILVSSILSLTLAFVPGFSTPKAHAATSTPKAHAVAAGCSGGALTGTNVYDSYGHLEGSLGLYWLCSTNGIAASFWSNNNTWQHVYVYVEYTDYPGYLENSAGYRANSVFWTGSYFDMSKCYYGEVDLVDNRGVNNWVGTASIAPLGDCH
ncbi:hypothetical protein [Ktedonobacter robiniae]|uniref:Secreted protein n=1 Tax=Ktedonobacter robiniae TaxID=2778365 RepID=A0ABQ3UQG8_9CHLR|nr:hypothetical protein [Ktedonobacter robiniae]GHO54610.1 hypothetical protein KSB_30850 [Ktedonobacter robiniae]